MTTIVAPPWEEQPTGGGIADALVKTEELVQRAAVGSGSAKDQGAAIDALITALEAAIAPVKAAT